MKNRLILAGGALAATLALGAAPAHAAGTIGLFELTDGNPDVDTILVTNYVNAPTAEVRVVYDGQTADYTSGILTIAPGGRAYATFPNDGRARITVVDADTGQALARIRSN